VLGAEQGAGRGPGQEPGWAAQVGLAQVALVVALEVLPDQQVVEPVAVIPQWITKIQEERRRWERPGNRQGASSSAQPHGMRGSTGAETALGHLGFNLTRRRLSTFYVTM
jgi:hypothetical protein